MKIILVMLWVVLDVHALSQPYPGPVSMGGAGTGATLRGNWAVQQNPAGLAPIQLSSVELGYVKHYMDKELSTQVALITIPLKSHKLGFSFQKYGLESYSDQLIGLTYGRSFGRQLSLGIGVSWHTLQIQNYGSSSILTAKAGFQFELTDRFSLGAYVFNPALSDFGGHIPIRIPAMMVIGFGFQLNDQIKLAADLHKLISDPPELRIGLDYSPLTWFSVRGGISAQPLTKYAGFSVDWSDIILSVAVSSHLDLGMSPQISLGYEF